MTIASVRKVVEVCDFCYEETAIGCTGVGPKTEIGVIEFMSICSRCRLTSLHPSILKIRKEVADYKARLPELEDYEWECYHDLRQYLEDARMDLRFLVDKTIEHYASLNPLLIRPLNTPHRGAELPGIYTYLDEEDHMKVLLVEFGPPVQNHHTLAAAFIKDLGLPSFLVIHPSSEKKESYTLPRLQMRYCTNLSEVRR